jgi:hypothetical protein
VVQGIKDLEKRKRRIYLDDEDIIKKTEEKINQYDDSIFLKRRGSFIISSNFFETNVGFCSLSKMLKSLSFIPTKVEFLFDRYIFQYTGFSPLFEEVDDQYETPEYILVFEKEGTEISLTEIKRMS